MNKRQAKAKQRKRSAPKSVAVITVQLPPAILPIDLTFSNPSRELAWDRLWDEIYQELLPVMIALCEDEERTAQETQLAA
jgi:hypothetical protein